MNEKEIKDMIEPIPNWEFTYRYDCSRTCGKSYTQSLLDEKDKKIKDLQKKVEQLEKENKELNNIIDNARKYIENNQSGCENENAHFHLNFDGDIWELYEMLRRF